MKILIVLACLSIANVAHGDTTTYRYDPATGHFLHRIGRTSCASPRSRALLLDTVKRVDSIQVARGKPMVIFFHRDHDKDEGLYQTTSRKGTGNTGTWTFKGRDGVVVNLEVHVEPYGLAIDQRGTVVNEIRLETTQVYAGGTCTETWVVDHVPTVTTS